MTLTEVREEEEGSTAAEAAMVVVVAVDDAHHSRAALHKAAALFGHNKDRAAEFHILHVRQHDHRHHDDSSAVMAKHHTQAHSSKAAVQGLLNRFAELAQLLGVRYHIVERIGDARAEICRYCADVNANLLVTGCRAAGQVKWMKLGSVSSYCTHHAPCPIMVFRDKDEGSPKASHRHTYPLDSSLASGSGTNSFSDRRRSSEGPGDLGKSNSLSGRAFAHLAIPGVPFV